MGGLIFSAILLGVCGLALLLLGARALHWLVEEHDELLQTRLRAYLPQALLLVGGLLLLLAVVLFYSALRTDMLRM